MPKDLVIDSNFNANAQYIKDQDGNISILALTDNSSSGQKVGIGTTFLTHMLNLKSLGSINQNFLRIFDSDNNNQVRLFSDTAGHSVMELYKTDGFTGARIHSCDTSFLLFVGHEKKTIY